MKNVIVLSIILLLAAACSPFNTQPAAQQCGDADALVDIDDVAIGAGIDDASAALAGDATEPADDQPATTTPAVTPATADIVKTVTEGDLVSFPNLKATDPDGDKITYTFSKPLDAAGKWQTKSGDAGEYPITITASDGKNTATQNVMIIVKKANGAPIINGPTALSAKEGENVALAQEISDPDGDNINVSYSGWMKDALRATTFGDAGAHTVTITATDGKLTTTKTVTITVGKNNRAPVIESLAGVSVKEGEKVIIAPKASDPDGDKVVFIFATPLDNRGTWQTKEGDAGSYDAKIMASDGELTDSTTVKITVTKVNKAPVISLSDLTVDEGDTVTLKPAITDPDGDKVSISYSGWMTSATKTTDYGDAGTHEVTVTATDALGNSVKKTIKVTVKDVNRPPMFDPNAFK